ncbi:ribonuclease G [Sinimarinibacterium sp. NLF-5-8]|uniref:ribonuclease G n=1 Tax=Sinimarinibacterium sp. NLF-5-8 TaxID=2698684 RepID=UPI00137C1E33|nr:ribonuclease G [Sinimarinibacterium sp. NLF-5-8]QHS10017.1 ribonuclease G [Sinimarinibacterium sp. NLF-5-8]
MSTEILVNIGQQETRVALVEGGAVQEVHLQRASRHGLAGNIYKGVVQRVLPGMQAAFVEIGLARTAFLHVADMLPLSSGTAEPPPTISQLLSEGQEIVVQVLKDPMGSKGARLTTLLSIPSRYLVLLPHERHVGVSARIEDEAERARLKTIFDDLQARLAPEFGLIARTAAEGADAPSLESDVSFLLRLWKAISEQAKVSKPSGLIHGDLPLSMRILRDLLGTDVERVRIDCEEECRRVKQFAQLFVPQAAPLIELYEGAAPIFDLYGVEDDINRALERRVELKSGGHLVIDQTEAMTTIDVNTGAYIGHRNLEETVLKTNLEAAQAIARQLRLRNLGGIIILDFIDMKSEDHRAQVVRALERALAPDHARIQVYPFSPLGLIEMTRKRTRESLGRILSEPCPHCDGTGTIKTVETVCHEVARELQRAARQFEARSFLVLASPQVARRFMEEEPQRLALLEEMLERPVRVQTETAYTQESFDVVPL